ncbi:MAG: hypothetical protein D6698_03615 [Gammaproteobacteria bacterium]|nr:MAG: hypothetical protein D6698_03615 [Gammaproteobacteria bacterium]
MFEIIIGFATASIVSLFAGWVMSSYAIQKSGRSSAQEIDQKVEHLLANFREFYTQAVDKSIMQDFMDHYSKLPIIFREEFVRQFQEFLNTVMENFTKITVGLREIREEGLDALGRELAEDTHNVLETVETFSQETDRSMAKLLQSSTVLQAAVQRLENAIQSHSMQINQLNEGLRGVIQQQEDISRSILKLARDLTDGFNQLMNS